MLRILTTLLILVSILLSPGFSYAHGPGTPPYVTINGEFMQENRVSLLRSETSNFVLPKDIAPQNYLVNQQLNFNIDESRITMFLPKELLATTKFNWDFGDGTKKTEMNPTHTYTKMGSYVVLLTLEIYEKNSTTPNKYTDSYLLHVLPNSNAELPKAVMKINNTRVNDPLADNLTINFKDKAAFDAGGSASSSEIVEYLWDFGDGATSDQKTVNHTYNNLYLQTPVLRIKDSNGFLAYTFARLTNSQTLHRSTALESQKQEITNQTIILSSGIALVLIAIVIVFLAMRKKK